MSDTSNRTISLIRAEQDWVKQIAIERKLSFSAAAGHIIRTHRLMTPEIRKQEALEQLRRAASILWKDCELPQEAIISWVREVTGGLEK